MSAGGSTRFFDCQDDGAGLAYLYIVSGWFIAAASSSLSNRVILQALADVLWNAVGFEIVRSFFSWAHGRLVRAPRLVRAIRPRGFLSDASVECLSLFFGPKVDEPLED